MRKSLKRNVKAVSPVIATIIIVAVAIVMAIAVAYWMLGLAGTFTRYEKLEFQSAYAVKNTDFQINMTLKNTGSSPATVTMFFLNGIPQNAISSSGLTIQFYNSTSSAWEDFVSVTVTINAGSPQDFGITLTPGTTIGSGSAVSGVTLEVMVQTAAGNQYPKTIVLP